MGAEDKENPCINLLIAENYEILQTEGLDCFGGVFYHLEWCLGYVSNMAFQEKKGTSCFGSVCIFYFSPF